MNRTVSRRSFVKACGLSIVAGAAALANAGCATKPSLTPGTGNMPSGITIATQQLPNDEEVAKAGSYLEQAFGCPVDIVEFNSGRDVNNALVANSVDFGELGSAPATLSIANRVPVKTIWIHQIIGEIEACAVKNDSGIETIDDLRGKSIATPFASTSHYSLMRALELNHISTSELTLLDMQPNDAYAAWMRGDIDAAYVWQPVLGELMGDGHILFSSDDMAKQGVVTSNVELVRTDFAEQYPDAVTTYIDVMNRMVELYNSDPDTAFQMVADSINLDLEEAKIEMSGCTWLTAAEQLSGDYLGDAVGAGKFADYYEDCANFLVTQQDLLEVPDRSVFEEGVDPTYIQRYLKQGGA